MATDVAPNWWKDLLSLWAPSGSARGERRLRLGLRDGYINFYLKGQSVARVQLDRAGRPVAEVHAKYAFEGATEQAYARLVGTETTLRNSERRATYSGLSTWREWMARAADWEGSEKRQVERIVDDNPGVIDLEAGLPAHEGQATAVRMDFVALEPEGNDARIVFWEAKSIADDRLRSRSGEPQVLKQIETYRLFLSTNEHRAAVIKAYEQTCRALVDLSVMADPARERLSLQPLVMRVARGKAKLRVDEQPRLVIFGSSAEFSSPTWRGHEARLGKVPILTIRTDTYLLREPAA